MVLSKDMQPILGGWGKQFYYNQFKVKIELPTPDKFPSLKGKVAIVTGSNVGLGYEAAKQLLTLGLSRLVVAVRSIERGNDAASKLQLANPKATIDVWLLDMESYESIQAFVRKCDTELSRIDFTILNAGLSKLNFTKTRSTGHELSIQVNHISTALLAILLLPVLKAKSTRDNTARLTVVNSVTAHAHNFTNCNLRPLLASYDDPKITPWQPQDRYRASKLLNQLFLVELTEHVSSDDVIINMVEPGLTKGTGLSRDATGAIRIAAKLFFGLAGRPTEIGAATYTDALLGHGKETHGCFLMNTEIAPLAAPYYTVEGKAATKQLWEETMEELKFANVKEIVASMK